MREPFRETRWAPHHEIAKLFREINPVSIYILAIGGYVPLRKDL
jgi:hypothetical protein